MTAIERSRIRDLMGKEVARFEAERPKSRALFERAKSSLIGGVPMPWMTEWAGSYPIFATQAVGARIEDVDGHSYVDFCLGDTGAMFGHSLPAVADRIAERVRKGITYMLPTEDAVWVGEELRRRFGLPYWQLAMTATDANRFALRIARDVTRRRKVMVFNGCYHGSVDEALIRIEDGVPLPGPGNKGYGVSPVETTRVVELNDLDALERELAHRDVAVVLAEPALTNVGIVLPDPGFHQGLRELTRKYGTLLLIDETHTISTGPGGYTREYNLQPDIFTLGKSIASGIPTAVYGFSEELAGRVQTETDVNGTGGTLAGNALALAAMRITFEHAMTDENYARMIAVCARMEDDINATIRSRNLPWHVIRLGARLEYRFLPNAPRNGGEAVAAMDRELDQFIHLFFLNRGILLTPFHNMCLVSPAHTEADGELHTRVFEECATALVR